MTAPAPAEPVPVGHHNSVLRRATARALELEPRLVDVLTPILNAAADEAARKFEQMATNHLTAAVDDNEAWTLASMPVKDARAALTASGSPGWSTPSRNEIVDADALVRKLRTKTDPVRLAAAKAIIGAGIEPAGLTFDATNPFTAKVLAQSGSQITNIAATTQLNAMRIISAAYDEGLSIPDTATALRGGMREASTARATLIARTELAGVVNGGSLAATRIVASATGQVYVKEWLTATGAKHPRHHAYPGLNHQRRPLDGHFDVGGHDLDHPGDPAGPPEEVCNCRCAIVYAEPKAVARPQVDAASVPVVEQNAATVAGMAADDAIAYYHTPKAFDLNGALRAGEPLTPEQAEVSRALDAAFEPSTRTVKLYRGVVDYHQVGIDDLAGLKKGDVISTPGYTSTSAQHDMALDFATGIAGPEDEPVIFQIVAPEGTPMLRVPSGEYGDQDEWLLPRNARLEVQKVVTTTDPPTVIVRVVDANESAAAAAEKAAVKEPPPVVRVGKMAPASALKPGDEFEFIGNIFRVVKVNDDGTVDLVTEKGTPMHTSGSARVKVTKIA